MDIGCWGYLLQGTDGGHVFVFLQWLSGRMLTHIKCFGLEWGKPSTKLIMEFLLQDELVGAEGMYGAANIRDLWKAYEVVKWEASVLEAKAMKFPLKLLKMALLGYATPRRVELAGSLQKN